MSKDIEPPSDLPHSHDAWIKLNFYVATILETLGNLEQHEAGGIVWKELTTPLYSSTKLYTLSKQGEANEASLYLLPSPRIEALIVFSSDESHLLDFHSVSYMNFAYHQVPRSGFPKFRFMWNRGKTNGFEEGSLQWARVHLSPDTYRDFLSGNEYATNESGDRKLLDNFPVTLDEVALATGMEIQKNIDSEAKAHEILRASRIEDFTKALQIQFGHM